MRNPIQTSFPKRLWIRFCRGDYIKFILGMAVMGLIWMWSAQITQAKYTLDDMREYAVIYLNANK